MTRSSVILTLWLLFTGGIGDELLGAGRSPLRLLPVYAFVSALTAFALWLELREDAPRAGPRRRRARFDYD
jgi:hypothetical protein